MLSNVKFKNLYDSKEDNLIYDFYIPALKNSKRYDRVSAYFDSKILRMYSAGLENIYKNEGKIRFIFSCDISDEDYNLMKKGYELKEIYNDKLLSSIFDEDFNSDLTNLSYLIAKGIVDIKIAFTKNGIFHAKYGLISDEDNNTVYFRGSNNETAAAVISNYESFETSLSWDCDSNEEYKIKYAIDDFERLWNDQKEGVIVLPLPNCVKDKLLSFTPESVNYIYLNKENTLIFDIDAEGKYIIVNNLSNKKLISQSSMIYLYKLKPYVMEVLADRIYLKNISYIKLYSLINEFVNIGNKYNFNVFVTPILREYLYSKDIEIDKRKSLGIAIKHRDGLVESDFEKFKYVVDNEMERQLREPQLWDAYHIVSMVKSANFSVPGAGKTSIVYGAFAYLRYYNKVNKVVMIGPKNSFSSWKKEFKLNFGNKLKLSYTDIQEDETNKKVKLKYNSDGKNLILINYESVPNLVNDIGNLIDDKTLLVFDEVHRIKSVEGKRARACLDLSKLATYKVVLTGTPIPNSYLDIYNMLHILYPDEYDTFFDFKTNELANAYKNQQKIDEINNIIYPFFCRTTKSDLLVPMPYEDDIETGNVEMNDEDARIVEILYNTYSSNILLLYIRLMQASTNPQLVLEKIEPEDFGFSKEDDEDSFGELKKFLDDKPSMSTEDYNYIKEHGKTRKLDKCSEIIADIVKKGNKVIAWGMFVKNLFLLQSKLKEKGIKSIVISGSMLQWERDESIEKFENGEVDVLITNPHTLAESISLHKTCHYAVYLEYSFNLTHMLQSRDRIHRLGITEEERPHYIYMFLNGNDCEYNTLDTKIYYRLKEKEKIMIDAVENAEILYIEDSYVDDIEYLLKRK